MPPIPSRPTSRVSCASSPISAAPPISLEPNTSATSTSTSSSSASPGVVQGEMDSGDGSKPQEHEARTSGLVQLWDVMEHLTGWVGGQMPPSASTHAGGG